LMWKPEGKRSLGRTRHRRADNIKNWDGVMDWIDLAEDRDR